VSLRDAAPAALKPMARRAAQTFGRATAGLRMLPDFIIAGGSRCGTTSLHRALLTHPGILPPVATKGVHYFDVGYTHSLSWYQGHFPLRALAAARTSSVQGAPLAFESSGYYMHHPMGPSRIAESLPGVKIVVMLRDPVERAYSAYKHEFARGFETERSFETALDLEAGRLAGEVDRLRADPAYISHAHRHQSYTDRGQYVEQVGRLFDVFGRERVHVLDSEAFFATPEPVYEELLAFLGLPVVHPPAYEQHNARKSSSMAQETADRLAAHFAPYDAALTELLGRTPAWQQR
jgi:Sulfotransferase domain